MKIGSKLSLFRSTLYISFGLLPRVMFLDDINATELFCVTLDFNPIKILNH